MSWKFVILLVLFNIVVGVLGWYALIATFGWIGTIGLVAVGLTVKSLYIHYCGTDPYDMLGD